MQARHSTRSHNEARRMSPGKCFNKCKATLACRYKITTGGIQPPHPWSSPHAPHTPPVWPSPDPPASPLRNGSHIDANVPEILPAQHGAPARIETTVAGTTTKGRRC